MPELNPIKHWGPWKDLTELSKDHAQGTVLGGPANGFQIVYTVNQDISIILANWQVEIQILAPDGVTVIWDCTFEVPILVTPGGGPFPATWSVENAAADTTVPSGPFSIFGVSKPITGGSVSEEPDVYPLNDGSPPVNFEMYTVGYLIPIPANAICKVKFHNIGSADLTFSPIMISLLPGGPALAARYLAADGMHRVVIPAGTTGGLQYQAACDPRALGKGNWQWSNVVAPTGPQVQSVITTDAGAGSPALLYVNEHTPVVFWLTSGTLKAKRSFDDGLTWSAEMDITTGVNTLIASAAGPDGGTFYHLCVEGSAVTAVVASTEMGATGPTVAKVDSYPATGLPSSLASGTLGYVNGAWYLHTLTSGTLQTWVSTDEMRTWQ